jgi:hypothetical protein
MVDEMGMARRVRRVTDAACCCAVAVLMLGGCAGNGKASPAGREVVDPGVELSPLTGWYALEPERPVLITWGADGGLRMFAFGERPMAARLVPEGGRAFRWMRPAPDHDRIVTFRVDAEGVAAGFSWLGANGQRHDAPALPDHGYRARELSFSHGGISLSGTWFVPRSTRPQPAVVMIHGSGDSDRDNFWYMSIAHGLASRKIAVLLPDKRGSGKSGGDWRTASFETLAGDAAAAARAAQDAQGIDGGVIGVVGLSQGGRIAPMVPRLTRTVEFVVNVSGAAVTPAEQLRHETRMTFRQSRWPGFLQPLLRPLGVTMARRRHPQWWRLNGDIDPIPYWKELMAPGLIVFGAADEYDNVPVARSVQLLREADRSGAPAGLTVVVFEGSGHALYAPGTTRVREDFLAHLADWIHAQQRVRRPDGVSF